MLGAQTIRDMSNVAAWRAAEEGREPLAIWEAEDLRHLPFLGEYVPAGWRRATWSDVNLQPRNVWRAVDDEAVTFMVDSSGFGSTGEPALTFPELAAYVASVDGAVDGWAIAEAGEFQVYVSAYVRDETAPEQGLPSEEEVTCEECGTVHGPFEDCDEEGYDERHPEEER